MKATVIVDNIPCAEAKGEWGLCIYIEYGDKTVLLDTGASPLFAANCRKLGLPLDKVDFAVLSHAHYDHADGIPEFFKQNQKAKMYFRDSAAADCYFKKFFIHKYIGIPKKAPSLYADRIEYAKGDTEISQGIYLIPHKTAGLSAIGKRENMYRRDENGWHPDDFSHEQSLVFDTDKGLIIFNSCSHGGAVNIINEVAATFPDKKVYALIGGFHLFNKPDSEVRQLGKKIKETGIEYVCTGHCTGKRAYSILKDELGDTVAQLHVGMVMEF